MLLPSFFVLGLVDEFERSVRTEGPESNWSNEFTEFTDSDFEKYLEGHRDKVAEAESTYSVRPRCNGVIDSAVACCAALVARVRFPPSASASRNIQMVFWHKVVG